MALSLKDLSQKLKERFSLQNIKSQAQAVPQVIRQNNFTSPNTSRPFDNAVSYIIGPGAKALFNPQSTEGRFARGLYEGSKRIVEPVTKNIQTAALTLGSGLNTKLAGMDFLPDSFQRRQANIAQTQAESALQDRRNRGLEGSGFTSGGAKTAFSGLGAAARPALAAYGLGNPALAATSALFSGGLSGGISALTGSKNVAGDVGSAVAYSPVYAGIGRLFNPLEEKVANAAVGKGGNFLARGLVKGSIFGGANFAEDEVLTRLLEGRDPTSQERITSFGVGLLAGLSGETGSAIKRSLKGKVPKDQVETAARQFVRDEVGRFAKQKRVRAKEPVFYGDIREQLGLPRDGDYRPEDLPDAVREGGFFSIGKAKDAPIEQNFVASPRSAEFDQYQARLRQQGASNIPQVGNKIEGVIPRSESTGIQPGQVAMSRQAEVDRLNTLRAASMQPQASLGKRINTDLQNIQGRFLKRTGLSPDDVSDSFAKRRETQGGYIQLGSSSKLKSVPLFKGDSGFDLPKDINAKTVMEIGPSGRPYHQSFLERAVANKDPKLMQKVLDAIPDERVKQEQLKLFGGILERLNPTQASKSAQAGLYDAKKPLYVDESGKNIVKEVGDYKIAANDLDNPTYLTVWKDGKQVGSLRTANKANGLDDYVQIGNVEVKPSEQGQGLATELYKTLADYLPQGKKGIAGYGPDIAAKKAIPRIYQKLGGSYDEATGNYIFNKPNVAQQPLGDTTRINDSERGSIQLGPEKLNTLLSGKQNQIPSQTSDDIISQGRKQIGSTQNKPDRSVKQTVDDIYTQWVDRYNPITKASEKVKGVLKLKGAELRPEADPSVLVRRLTGAGGIADYKYRTELKPIVDQMDNLKIDKLDMDVYLANKRLAGFGEIGREVKGSDPVKAKQIVNALETKYGSNISQVADQLYKYQNKGFQEMIDAGFISPEAGKIIQSQNPDYAPLNRVMDEMDNYLGLPTRKTMQGSQPIQKLKGSERLIDSPLENIIANTFKQRAAIEKNRVAKSLVNLQQIADLGFSKVSKSGDDVITVWNNGNKEYWRVGEEIASTAKGLNEENMNSLLKIFTAPARLLRQGATGRNPDFMIPNIVRDQLDAGVTSRYGYIPFIDYLSGLKSMIANDDIYNKWQQSGAKIDLGEMSGRKTIQASFDTTKQKAGLFKWVGSALDTMGKYSEQPTRVGLFKKAYKNTGNELLAMMESRDATVDFARMGSKMKVANSIVPFLNVGVQGFDKLIRATKNNPAKVALNASIYGALPAVMTVLYNLVNFKDEYAEIPQYEKDSNFVLVTGRNASGTVDYLSVPKGNVLPLITNPIQSFLAFTSKNSQQTFNEFATQFLSSALPVVGDGQSLKEVGVKTIGSNLPQLIKPITENLVNKSFWKYNTDTEQTKEIVPSYLQKKAPYEQSYEWTPKAYKAIGSVLNVSPLQVQNLMEGYLAGYTKIPAQIVDGLFNISKGKPIETNQTPILRRFVKETYPSSNKKPVVQQEAPGLMERITGKVSAAEDTLPTNPNDFKVLYQSAQNKIDGYKDNSSKIRTGLKDNQTLQEAQAELVEAKNMIRRMETENPEMVYKVGLDVYESGGGKTTIERADWAEKWLKNSKDQSQYDSWYKEMLEK